VLNGCQDGQLMSLMSVIVRTGGFRPPCGSLLSFFHNEAMTALPASTPLMSLKSVNVVEPVQNRRSPPMLISERTILDRKVRNGLKTSGKRNDS